MGVGYVVHPLCSSSVVGTLAAVVSHYLAADEVTDLRDVTSRLSSAAERSEWTWHRWHQSSRTMR